MNVYIEKDKHVKLEVWVRSTTINTVTLTMALVSLVGYTHY